jgi:hypothetical protein
MTSVLLVESEGLIADVIRDPHGDDRIWVCVGTGRRAGAQGWLGCWSSEDGLPGETEVVDLLCRLADFTRANVKSSRDGQVLVEHYFRKGWSSWGPGTPGPLRDLAVESAAEGGAPIRIADFRMDG